MSSQRTAAVLAGFVCSIIGWHDAMVCDDDIGRNTYILNCHLITIYDNNNNDLILDNYLPLLIYRNRKQR